MYRMGGLRKRLPVTFWTFLIGSASLSALPLVTAGFYSKDLILWNAYSSPYGSVWLWAAGLVGAFITSLYTFRMVFLTFYGVEKSRVAHQPTLRMQAPLMILAFFSIVAGFVEMPPALGNVTLFSRLVQTVLPETTGAHGGAGTELLLAAVAGIVSLVGIYLAYLMFYRRVGAVQPVAQTREGSALSRFWASGWGFDWLYNHLFVFPYIWLSKVNKDDIVDSFYDGIAWLAQGLNAELSLSQTGRVRWYAFGLTLGVVILVGVVLFL